MKHRKTTIPHKHLKKVIPLAHKEKQNLQELVLKQYCAMFDSMVDVIHLVDTNLRIVMVNKMFKRWSRQLGLDTNITGRKLSDVCPFLSRKVLDEYKKVFRTGKIIITEEKNKFVDREIFTETRKIPVLEKNKVTGVITVIRNITEGKRAEKALQKSEERFRQVVENAQEWIWEVDANGLYTYASPIVEKILGYKPEEIVKKKYFYDLFHPEDREKLKKGAFEVIAKKQSFREFINQNIHKNGETVWLSTSGVPLLDEKGNLLGYRGVDTNITEHKKAEEALRESEERLSRFMDSAPDSFFLFDSSLNIIDINKTGLRILGLNKKDLIGKNILDITSDLKKTGRYKKYMQVIKTGRPLYMDDIIDHPKFKSRNVSIKAFKVGNGLGLITTDITERKEIEQALRNSEKMYKTLVKTSPDAVTVTDLEGHIIEISRRTLELHGFKNSKELIGKSALELIAPEDRERAIINLKKTLDKGFLESAEYTLLRKDGTSFLGELNAALIKNVSGNPKAFIATTRDITERKKSEEQILIANERLKYLLSSSSAVIYTARPYGDYGATFISDNVTHLVGYEPQQFIRNSDFWTSRIHPKDKQKVLTGVLRIFKTGSYSYEYRFRHKDGRYIWVRDDMRLIRDKSGNPVEIIGYWIDITKRKEVEKIKDNLIRDISHGLKSPVAMTEMAFNIFQEGLRAGNIGQIQQAERIASNNLRKIRKDVDNMLEIFTLDMRKMIEKKKYKVSLRPVINEIIKNMKYLIEEKRLRLNIDIPQEANKVLIDRRDIKTLMYNIIDNAIKFTDQGSISIKVGLKQEMVQIDVKDTGCGIEEEDKNKVFDKFYKRHAAIEGSGLGLSICKEIVQMYNGKIRIDSKGPGKGTTVTVLLPKG